MLTMVNNCFSPHEISGVRRPVPDIRVRPEPIPVNRIVSVHTERDQFPKSRSTSGSTHQDRYKAHEVILNGDEENGPEKI
jgi:hypothetical protein